MQDALPTLFAIALIVVTIVLSVVGVQLVLTLLELKRTLLRVNQLLDQVEDHFDNIVTPLRSLGGIASGLQTGFKVFEGFIGWLNRPRDNRDEE